MRGYCTGNRSTDRQRQKQHCQLCKGEKAPLIILIKAFELDREDQDCCDTDKIGFIGTRRAAWLEVRRVRTAVQVPMTAMAVFYPFLTCERRLSSVHPNRKRMSMHEIDLEKLAVDLNDSTDEPTSGRLPTALRELAFNPADRRRQRRGRRALDAWARARSGA
jgi:hypothetical protein